MWNPTDNWGQQGSFVQPVTPPDVEPDATPEVSLCFSAAWLPYILGCFSQLMQPTTWDTTDPAILQLAQDRSQKLMDMFAAAGPCEEGELIRWNTATCSIQQSIDGGATWSDIPGWDIEALADCLEVDLPPAPIVRWSTADCALEVSLDNGATYSAIPGWDLAGLAGCLQMPLIDIGGASGPGIAPPAIPPGGTTASMACSIATWLAIQILQGSMSSMAGSLGATATALESALGLFGLATGFSGVGGLFFEAAGIFVGAATSIGETALNTASSDAGLRGDLICAIETAIASDGAVTPGNFATVLSNINAISYATPGIVGLLHDYVSNLGFAGISAIQSEGSLFAASCSCGGVTPSTNCLTFNGTDDYADAVTDSILPPPGGAAGFEGGWAIMAWSRQASSTAYQGVYNSCGPNGTGSGALNPNRGQGFLRIHGSSHVPEGGRGIGNGSQGDTSDPVSGTSPGVWAHVAVVYSSFAGGYPSGTVVYINGTAISTSSAGPGNFGIGGPLAQYIGNLSSGDSEWLDGDLSDIRVYDTVPTGAMIAAIYAAGPGAYPTEGAPRHWWTGDEGSGSTIHDHGAQPTDMTWHGSGSHWGTI